MDEGALAEVLREEGKDELEAGWLMTLKDCVCRSILMVFVPVHHEFGMFGGCI